MVVFYVILLLLVGWMAMQGWSIRRFAHAGATRHSLSLLVGMGLVTILVAMALTVGAAPKWSVLVAPMAVNAAIAILFQRRLGDFVLFEGPFNQMQGQFGEPIPFQRGTGIPYIPNWIVPAVAGVTYLSTSDRIAELICCIAFALSLPTFAIKLIGERRF